MSETKSEPILWFMLNIFGVHRTSKTFFLVIVHLI